MDSDIVTTPGAEGEELESERRRTQAPRGFWSSAVPSPHPVRTVTPGPTRGSGTCGWMR
jgi:hypothetical protein